MSVNINICEYVIVEVICINVVSTEIYCFTKKYRNPETNQFANSDNNQIMFLKINFFSKEFCPGCIKYTEFLRSPINFGMTATNIQDSQELLAPFKKMKNLKCDILHSRQHCKVYLKLIFWLKTIFLSSECFPPTKH